MKLCTLKIRKKQRKSSDMGGKKQYKMYKNKIYHQEDYIKFCVLISSQLVRNTLYKFLANSIIPSKKIKYTYFIYFI